MAPSDPIDEDFIEETDNTSPVGAPVDEALDAAIRELEEVDAEDASPFDIFGEESTLFATPATQYPAACDASALDARFLQFASLPPPPPGLHLPHGAPLVESLATSTSPLGATTGSHLPVFTGLHVA